MREFIHAILRKELVKNPTTVFFTGKLIICVIASCFVDSNFAREVIFGFIFFVHDPFSFFVILGHSLGGALATFAALDVSLHTIPRVNAWLKHQEK